VDLPLILAGPIVRRVEPAFAAVWMAVSHPASIQVDVYPGIVDAHAPPGSLASVHAGVVATGSGRTRRVGERLHIAVVTAHVVAAVPRLLPGQLFGYNVTVTPDGGQKADLNSERLLIDAADDEEHSRIVEEPRFHLALGYAKGRLPGFATCPARTEDLVLLHGSCQKPHGLGAPMQAQFDATIEAVKDTPILRPHRMFLTGDQIYADDVATCLLPGLAALGKQLLFGDQEGASEIIKGPGQTDANKASEEAFPAGRRAKIAAIAGLTQEAKEGRNHLLSLAEYCALYVISFSSRSWPPLAKGYVPTPESPDHKPVDDLLLAAIPAEIMKAIADDAKPRPPPEGGTPPPDNRPVVLAPVDAGALEASLTDLRPGDATRDSTDEFQRRNTLVAEVFRQFIEQKLAILGKTADAKIHQRADTAKFQRALANVPTYMQFDDHDCTDDWFITGEWRNTVLGNVLGQAVVRNAMVAGTMFQAWGNDPGAWSGDRGALLDAIERLFPSGVTSGPDDAASVAINTLLGLIPGAEPKFDFSYAVDGPTHRVVVLDTRTRREYRTPQSPPGLLSAASLDQQLPAGPLPSGLEVLIVISPAPVLGPPLITDFAQPLLISKVEFFAGIRMKKQQRDEEAQSGIPGGRVPGSDRWDLEQWHVNPEAFERLLDRLSTYPRVVVLAGDVHYGAAFTLAYERRAPSRVSRIVHFTCSAMRNGWDRPFPEIMNHHTWGRVLQRLGLGKRQLAWDSATPDVLADSPTGERLSLRGRLHRSPVLLPDTGWVAAHPLARPPDWVWELQQVMDVRPAAQRPEATRPPELSEPDVPALPVDPPSPAPPVPPLNLLHPPPGQLGYARLAQAHQEAIGQGVARGLQFLNNVGKITFRRTDDHELEVSQTLISLRDKPEDEDKPDAYIVYTTSLAPTSPTIPARIGEP
jgi:hypothetical protein